MICSTIQSIDKALVARRFAHARNTYGREALVQQQVAEKMLRLLTKHACPSAAAHNGEGNTRSLSGNASPFRHIVEFGCGTRVLLPFAAARIATGNSAAQRLVSRK